jgi:hypothetical protein
VYLNWQTMSPTWALDGAKKMRPLSSNANHAYLENLSFGSSRKSLAADKSLHESAVHAASNCHEERGRLGPLVDVSDREMVIR